MPANSFREDVDERAQIVVKAFSNWVNNMGHENHLFVDAVMQEHRTIQQQLFETMLACISGWARSEYYDPRNEFTVMKCREIVALFPNGTKAPFI